MGFEDVVDSEGFVFAHHNDRDMDSFERFRCRAQDRYVRNQQNRRVREIDSNVKLWDLSLIHISEPRDQRGSRMPSSA